VSRREQVPGREAQLRKYTNVLDTEFTIKQKVVVDSIQLYCPELDYAEVVNYPDLDPSFNPFTYLLERKEGLKNLFVYTGDSGLDDYFRNDLNESFNGFVGEFYTLQEELVNGREYNRQEKRRIEAGIAEGIFDHLLEIWGLTSENLKVVGDKKTKEISIEIHPPQLEVTILTFFQDADIFKAIGKAFQFLFNDSQLEKRRVIKVSRTGRIIHPQYFVSLAGILHEPVLSIRDVMHRLPPRERGLDAQCKIFKAEHQKFDIETPEYAERLGVEPKRIKENMTLFRETFPEAFERYAIGDVYATWALHMRQSEYFNKVRADLDLDPKEIKDTAGANVSSIISDLMVKHFNPSTKEDIKLLKTARRNAHWDKLAEAPNNHFGTQVFRTIGGLLYSRVSNFPYIKGSFGDLDLSSCYATKLSSMSVYLGAPVISVLRNSKATLRDVLEVVKARGLRRDAWFCRVSGELHKAINTLVLSDLAFKPKMMKPKTLFSINPNRKSICQFDAFKVSEAKAESTLLLKEVLFGFINQDILDCLSLLPSDWYEEFLGLRANVFIHVPNELICHDLEEYEQKGVEQGDFAYIDALLADGQVETQTKPTRENVCLEFPISDYIEKLKILRGEYKKQGDPIQEVYKLINNSTYGAMACQHLGINNLMAANQITASARSAAWLMMNAMNGFQVITDGCTFSWENIPTGKTFHQILEENPWYVADFDPAVKSGLTYESFNQEWIDSSFRAHMGRFYGVEDSYLLDLYGYELKKEAFKDSQGQTVKTLVFTEFVNHGSGSYSKGVDGTRLFVEGEEHEFRQVHPEIKARSFYGKDKGLVDWYIDTLKNGYKTPFLYTENQIIKFSDGNKKAIYCYLKKADTISHPMGTGMTTYKLMKIISRSQFLFMNKKQLRSFENINEQKLSRLSRFFLDRTFWKSLKEGDLEEYGAKILPDIDYFEASKERPIGIGIELLCLNGEHKGSIESVRRLINDKIRKGKTHLNAVFNIDYNVKHARHLANLFAAVIVLRANEDKRLTDLFVNSVDEPTLQIVRKEHIKRYEDLFYRNE